LHISHKNNQNDSIAEYYDHLTSDNQQYLPPSKIANTLELFLVIKKIINKSNERNNQQRYF